MSDEVENEIREQLSCWMDEELLRDQARFLQRRLDNDPSLRDTWARYHLIGDALRDALPPHISLSLAERVQAAIADEAAGTMPVARRRRPVLGFGMAASLAVMAGSVLWTRLQAPEMDAQSAEQATLLAVAPAASSASDPQLEAMLANHSELLARNGGAGMVPYVRMADYSGSRDTANK